MGGINNISQIVGTAVRRTADGTSLRAFFWENGKTFPLPPLSGDSSSSAWASSETDVVIGSSGFRPRHPVLWVRKGDGSFGAPVDLSAFTAADFGWDLSQASRLWISRDGRFAGSLGYTPVFDPLVTGNQGSVLFELDSTGGYVSATPIGLLNQIDDGLVVDAKLKMAGSIGIPQLAARWDDGRVTNLHPAGLPGGSVAHKINKLNQVVGDWHPGGGDGFVHAAYWDENGVFVDIFKGQKVRDSDAWGINDAGDVVGEVDVGTDELVNSQGFLWNQSTGTKMLASLTTGPDASGVAQIRTGFAINNAGQILALGTRRSDGSDILLLMTPEIRPHLEIRMQAGQVMISWPASTAGFDLESSSTSTGAWNQVIESPVTLDDQKLVILPINPGTQFFRLRQQ
jgi:uncharacterized membrane protein